MTSEQPAPGTLRSSLPDFAIGDDFLKSSDAFNARGRAGFALANDSKSGHSCPMEFNEDIRKYAAEQGVSEDEAMKEGTETKAKEFGEEGAKA